MPSVSCNKSYQHWRIDVTRFRFGSPYRCIPDVTKIAIIGAGLAGLTLAHRLRPHADITVFEKSRGVGGRMATRYAEEFEFDHGAQFFTARSTAFQDFLQPLREAGAVACWHARFAELERARLLASRQWDDEYPHYVGAPRMNSVGAYLAADVRVRKETTITGLVDTAGGWRLESGEDSDPGCFDWVVFTMPPAQAVQIAAQAPALCELALPRKMLACYALMLGFESRFDPGWDAARVLDADISWISVNSSKPGRGRASTLLVHSTNAWADANLEADPDRVVRHLLAETSAVAGPAVDAAKHVALHRWRFANIGTHDGPASFCDAAARLAACGDWFVRGRVEAAFRSANHLAELLLAEI